MYTRTLSAIHRNVLLNLRLLFIGFAVSYCLHILPVVYILIFVFSREFNCDLTLKKSRVYIYPLARQQKTKGKKMYSLKHLDINICFYYLSLCSFVCMPDETDVYSKGKTVSVEFSQ